MKKIIITTGDCDGIGSEITAKALSELKVRNDVQFFVWRSPHCPLPDIQRLSQSAWTYKKVSCWQEALKASPQYTLIDIESRLSPVEWIEQSALEAQKGLVDALVTAPLSKEVIHLHNPLDKGHTDILKRVCQNKNLFMSFIGEYFAVLLLTDHIALSQVSQKLNQKCIVQGLLFANHLQKAFFKDIKPIGLLGLNPHAGENNILGCEEQSIFIPALKEAQKQINVEGPLVSDVVFQEKHRERYNVFVASYHDQGLIPFKSLHKSYTGTQVTMGLNFIRTSVDHGTAKDIFSKDKAQHQSMINAINNTLRLLKSDV